jgi:mannose-6-phosphate isomerase-like protein (cupin superfamily)
VPVDLLVLVTAMIPRPGETGIEWWDATGWEQAQGGQEDDPMALFLHDVPPDLADEAMRHGRRQSRTPMQEPWPLDAWPDVPTRFLLCRQDRFFPAGWMREVVEERLGLVPDEIDAGHCPALSRPRELAERLETYREETAVSRPYTIRNLRAVEDSAPGFGLGDVQQTRFATTALETEETGFTHHRIRPGARPPFAHRHQRAEEVYVVLSGSGRVKLDDDVRDVAALDAIRVSPSVVRTWEAGPDGLELLAFGPRREGDGEVFGDWWTASA